MQCIPYFFPRDIAPISSAPEVILASLSTSAGGVRTSLSKDRFSKKGGNRDPRLKKAKVDRKR